MAGNYALRVLLDEAGMSNAGLARAVVAAGAEEGVHLGTNATSVKRMLTGCQPRWPVPRLVAKVLSRRLGFAVKIEECGFVDRGELADTFDAFARATSIGGTIAIVAELSSRDIRRRNLMLGAAFTAAAFAEPAWLAMTMPAERVAARVAGNRVGASDVAVISDTVRHFERLQRRYGGGTVRDQVVSYVQRQADVVVQSTYTERVGSELLRAMSQATWLAGLTSVDSGRHALGQAYYAQALNLAQQSGDKLYAANVLAEMSRTTMDVGNAAGEAASYGQHAVALARSAVQVAGRSATPAFGAWLHAMEARGLTMLGDHAGAAGAVDDAQRSFERAGGDEPEWFGFYGEPDLLADVGLCLRDAGRPRQGLVLLERAAAALPADRVTARVKTQIHIAAAQVELGEFEAAGAYGRPGAGYGPRGVIEPHPRPGAEPASSRLRATGVARPRRAASRVPVQQRGLTCDGEVPSVWHRGRVRKTTIYLDEADERLLREAAARRGSSRAEFIREAIRQFAMDEAGIARRSRPAPLGSGHTNTARRVHEVLGELGYGR